METVVTLVFSIGAGTLDSAYTLLCCNFLASCTGLSNPQAFSTPSSHSLRVMLQEGDGQDRCDVSVETNKQEWKDRLGDAEISVFYRKEVLAGM